MVAKQAIRLIIKIARDRRLSTGAAFGGALALSSCTYHQVDDPKYRLDEVRLFDRVIFPNFQDNAMIAEVVRREIERLVGENRSIPDYERVVTSLGATCSGDGRGIRCSYTKQVRWTAMLYPPTANHYEYEIKVARARKGEEQMSVCFGSGATGSTMSGLPDYHAPHKWRCSPATAISDACKADPDRNHPIYRLDCGG